jgi:NAD(P) transhydrogenase subunit alpha
MPDLAPVHAGLLRETYPGERRVALTPEDVARLSMRVAVSFEPGCGTAAGHADDAYVAAGGTPASLEVIAAACEIIVSVRRPQAGAIFRNAAILIFLGTDAASHEGLHPNSASLELDLARLEGLQDAGCMDAATAQATISGHAAVLEGARQLGVGHPMLMIDGSFVRPIRMAAFGADAASLQAIATARRLGTLTHAFTFTDDERLKVERLGARSIAAYPSLASTVRGPSSSERAARRRQLAGHLAQMQLIVTSVGGSIRPAPLVLDEETIATLAPGTVVIDLAASRGGNCALTRAEEVVTANGVRILGSTNFASCEPREASRLFGEGIRTALERLIGDDRRLRLDRRDPVIDRLLGRQATGARIAS